MKGIYYGTLDKFGYDLTAVGKTKQEVIDALMEEYEETFIQWNGYSSKDDVIDWQGKSYYDSALESAESSVEYYEFGKVVWR